jgi:hypothetical protein
MGELLACWLGVNGETYAGCPAGTGSSSTDGRGGQLAGHWMMVKRSAPGLLQGGLHRLSLSHQIIISS